MFFYLEIFFILVNIPMDLDFFCLMYVIWSDQFNLLSMINPKNLVLLTHYYIAIIFRSFVFHSGTMEHHIASSFNNKSQFV